MHVPTAGTEENIALPGSRLILGSLTIEITRQFPLFYKLVRIQRMFSKSKKVFAYEQILVIEVNEKSLCT